MDDGRRRRSNIVALTMIGVPVGAIALADAFPPHAVQRNLYLDRAACERDYSAAQCQRGGTGGSFGISSSWHGPYYSTDRTTAAASDPGPGRTGQITRTEISSRGGFGAFGRVARGIG
ncbi:MAG TPA: hypothetical protein VHY35_19220 [Stellaceae bacterium]|jgi:hypothetical protein|nr:hypothetical protein [Stellaceae bacterium]